MKIIVDRVVLVILIVAAAYTGLWAYVAPMSFYENFPGFGLSWLPQLGPFNAHFIKDLGAMYVALGVLSVFVLWRVREYMLARIAGAVWFTFNLLHFIFHMTMLGVYDHKDRVLNVITLGGLLVLSLILLLPGESQRRRVRRLG